ncbi:Uncharacterised protein, partial [Metamycoplasma alkalescens]
MYFFPTAFIEKLNKSFRYALSFVNSLMIGLIEEDISFDLDEIILLMKSDQLFIFFNSSSFIPNIQSRDKSTKLFSSLLKIILLIFSIVFFANCLAFESSFNIISSILFICFSRKLFIVELDKNSLINSFIW